MDVKAPGRRPPLERGKLDLPFSRAVVESACQDVPGLEPIAAQMALCEMLTMLARDRPPDVDQLGAVLALDGHARQVCERLLLRYVEGDAQLRSFDRKVLVAALRLAQSMARAYEHFLQFIEKSSADDWHEHSSRVIVGFLHFRQVEFLIRIFRYKKRNAEQWRSLHETYRFALKRDLHRRPARIGTAPGAARTPEQQYIQLLLLELMNDGQFSPREALWAYGWLARWSTKLTLEAIPSPADGVSASSGFAVDLAGAEGAARAPIAVTGAVLHLDTTPLMALIEEDAAAMKHPATPASGFAPAQDGQFALLGKLRMLLTPVRAHIERRGERRPAAATVQTIIGLPSIVRALREAAQKHDAPKQVPSALNEQTIGAFGGPTQTLTAWGSAGFGSMATPEVWQLKDRSNSGCRLRGKTSDLNHVIPGTLLAIRTGDNEPWSVITVRRLRRLMVDHVEIGAEHVGRKPRYVKVASGEYRGPPAIGSTVAAQKYFGALYLPASDEYPSMPIRTLLLPAREFAIDATMTLLSSIAVYTLRLNEPIRREFEYVWTSFTVLARTDLSEPNRPS